MIVYLQEMPPLFVAANRGGKAELEQKKESSESDLANNFVCFFIISYSTKKLNKNIAHFDKMWYSFYRKIAQPLGNE